jgi:hypothetical protein
MTILHTPLASNPDVVELIASLSGNGEWTKDSGRKVVGAPYIVVNGEKYVVRKDIRDTQKLITAEE